MYMGNRSWYSYFTELTESSIISTGNNKLKVFKIGQLLYYFINNVYCYSSEIVATDTLNEFGFIVPSQGVVWIDNFKISKKGSTNISSKAKQNLKFEFGIQKTSSFNLNKINNQ
jgi:predicted nucleic-acid-binding Zn-ribbon protein